MFSWCNFHSAAYDSFDAKQKVRHCYGAVSYTHLLLGQAADLDESETLLVIDGQSIPAWEYLYWLALDCRQMEERCEAAGEPVDWTAPLSEGGTLEDLVKADALADTALYAAVGTWAAAYGCTLTDAERNALPERHYAYLTLEQGRHLTETGVQYAKLYACLLYTSRCV